MTEENEWQVGDSVFAPWEPLWLYPATILCIDEDEDHGDVALVKFLDGDRQLCPPAFLQSVTLRPGKLVFCKASPESLAYWPALVLGVSDDGLRVRFMETDREETVTLRDCRLMNITPEFE